MKQLLSLLLLFQPLLLLAPVALSQQEEWVEVTENAVGDRFLVNQSSLQTRENFVWYWEYRDFREPNNAFLEIEFEAPVYGVMMYQSVDCTTKIARLRRLTIFGEDREVLQRFDYGEEGSLSQPAPGSSARTVLQYVCSQTAG
jgi:hypothetical protein